MEDTRTSADGYTSTLFRIAMVHGRMVLQRIQRTPYTVQMIDRTADDHHDIHSCLVGPVVRSAGTMTSWAIPARIAWTPSCHEVVREDRRIVQSQEQCLPK